MSRLLAVLVVVVLAPRMGAAQTVEYYHLDALGSVRAVSDQSGAVIERHDYLPFGEEVNPPGGASPRQFTGKERDAETGFDYFGARYYSGKRARFTTVDPVYTWTENLVDPQRWNRYAYARNNPLRYTDPDGREVKYANAQLQALFTQLSVRSEMVRDTLGLYTGAGKPDLFITHGDAGKDIDGSPASGVFRMDSKNLSVSYAGMEDQIKPGMTVQQIENLGTWTLVGQTTLTIDKGLTVSFQDRATVNTALHELGHADQAARAPLQYFREAQQNRLPDGRVIPHDRRPSERVANQYRDRAQKEIR